MSNWSKQRLLGKINVKHGFPFKGEFFADSGNQIVLTPGNFFEEGGFKQQIGKEKFYTGEIPEEYVHERGDLIVAMTEQAAGLLGSCALIPESGKYLHNQRLGLITTDQDKILKDFIYHLFKIKYVREQIRLTSSGSKVKHTSPERIYDVQVLLPSIKEQKNIACLLNSIEEKIEINKQIKNELQTMTKVVYDYWFLQFDFPNDDGKPYKASGGKMVLNSILKQEIPNNWGVKKLANVTTLVRRGISPNYAEKGGTPVLNQKCIRDQTISFSESRRHQTVLDDSDVRLLEKYDVLINSTGVGTLGRVAFVKRLLEKKTTIDSHVSIVRADSDNISKPYFAFTLLRYQQIIEVAANGSTGQVELSKSFLEDIDIIVPDGDVQDKFDKFVEPVVEKIATIEKEVEELKGLHDWLLPMLMNGQVTVK